MKYTPPVTTTSTTAAAAGRIDEAVTESAYSIGSCRVPGMWYTVPSYSILFIPPYQQQKIYLILAGCGMCLNITREGGIIESPNYPAYYGEDLNCQITLTGPTGTIVQLNLTDFNLDTCCDFISVSH